MTKPRRGESHIICTFFSFKTSELRRCRHGIASIIPPKTAFLGARHFAAYPTWELLVLKHLNAPLPVKYPSRRELLGNTCQILPSSFGLVRIQCHGSYGRWSLSGKSPTAWQQFKYSSRTTFDYTSSKLCNPPDELQFNLNDDRPAHGSSASVNLREQ